tara:strand:- start:5316 stop:5645 length:330 start_codon:yes stop_codon:yes gene_type:complete
MYTPSLDLSFIETLSGLDVNQSIPMWARFVKLSEEVGEANAAYLCRQGVPNRSGSSDPNVEEEVVDAMINCLDILFRCGMTVPEIQNMLNRKCQKWADKMKYDARTEGA